LYLYLPLDKGSDLYIIRNIMTDQSVRKIQIMEKAKELFAEKGYHPVTMEEVAQSCGVAKGTVYLYFESKAELFIEIFVEAHRVIIEKIREIIGSVKGFEASISKVFDYFEEFIRGNRFFSRFGKVQKGMRGANIPLECLQKINESVAEMIGSLEKEAVDVLKGYLPDSKLNLNDLYEIVVALILGIEESDSKTIKNTALSVLLDGVKKEVKC
jgi:AcrR family transcriptional regulator